MSCNPYQCLCVVVGGPVCLTAPEPRLAIGVINIQGLGQTILQIQTQNSKSISLCLMYFSNWTLCKMSLCAEIDKSESP